MGVIHDKPATHPTPWKWNGEDGGIVATTALLDATGAEVVYVLDAGDWGVSIQICNPNVRALLAAAPEMADLLRRALFETQPNGVCGDIHETDDWRERMKALLDRIDAAKAAT